MSLAHRLSSANRDRKWRRFRQEFAITPALTVLDVGFSDREYSPVDNYLEKHYPYLTQVTAVGIDKPDQFNERYPEVKAEQYDGRTLPFPDKAFDVCWSNAVIEHVGTTAAQIAFVKELVRVGKAVFFSTPNRHFPIEVHTRVPLLHFLPKSIFDAFLRATGKSWATGDYMNLLGLRDLRAILRDANVSDYKLVKNRLMGFPLDFVVIIHTQLDRNANQ